MTNLDFFNSNSPSSAPLPASPKPRRKTQTVFRDSTRQTRAKSCYCQASTDYSSEFSDEISAEKGDKIRIYHLDKSGVFGRAKNHKTGQVGWIEINALSKKPSQLKLPRYVHNFSVPDRLQKNVKYLKKLEKVAKIIDHVDPEDMVAYELDDSAEEYTMALKNDVTIKPQETKFVRIEPLEDCKKFVACIDDVEFKERFKSTDRIDTIRGSWAPAATW